MSTVPTMQLTHSQFSYLSRCVVGAGVSMKNLLYSKGTVKNANFSFFFNVYTFVVLVVWTLALKAKHQLVPLNLEKLSRIWMITSPWWLSSSEWSSSYLSEQLSVTAAASFHHLSLHSDLLVMACPHCDLAFSALRHTPRCDSPQISLLHNTLRVCVCGCLLPLSALFFFQLSLIRWISIMWKQDEQRCVWVIYTSLRKIFNVNCDCKSQRFAELIQSHAFNQYSAP